MPRGRRLALSIAALVLTAAGIALALSELATPRGGHAVHSTPEFLTRALGAPQRAASLVRAPSRHVRVAIRSGGFGLAAPEGSVGLEAPAVRTGGAWAQFENGATRRTPFGRETVTVSPTSVEQFLTVGRRQGLRTWRWRLDTKLAPRENEAGYVGFFAGQRLVPLSIRPVQILDGSGRDVTPKGLAWRLVQTGGSWWIELRLDDRKLPLPYTIDPGAWRDGTTNISTGAGSIAMAVPPTARVNDVLVAHVAQVSTAAIAAPAGWTAITGSNGTNSTIGQASFYHVVVAGDLPSGSWNFTVSARAAITVDDFQGIDSTAVVLTNGTSVPAAAGTARRVQCPAITPAAGTSATQPEHIVCDVGWGNSVSYTGGWPAVPIAGYTYESDTTSGTGISVATYDRSATSTTAIAAVTDSVNLKGTTSARWNGTTFGLKDDWTAPTNGAVSAGSISPANVAYQASAGSTIYFNGTIAGSFTLSDPFTDGESSMDSVNYPLVSTAGWTHANETPATYPSFTSSAYSWSAGAPTAAPSIGELTLTETNGATLTSTQVVPMQEDDTAPTSSVQCNSAACSAGWYTTSPVAVQITGADTGGSGVRRIVYTTDGTTPTIDATDTVTNGTVLTGTSGSFNISTLGATTVKWIVEDNVRNVSGVTSQLVQLDTTAPSAPTGFTFSSFTNAYSPGSGSVVYFKAGTAGGFTVAASGAADAESGVASYTYPALTGSGWSNVADAYTFTAASPTASGSVTATNGAGLIGSGTTFTAQSDATAPTGGAFSANGTAATGGGSTSYLTAGTTLTIDSRTDYAETQSATESGLASSLLTMRTGTLSGNSCSGYGAPSTITGTTSQTVASGNCYELTLTGTDNVGNATSIKTTVMVDTTAPSAPTTFGFASLTNAYYPGSGSTVYFQSGSAGGFTVSASGASDADTGISSYTYGAIAGSGWSNTAGAYTFTAASPTGTGSVTATNGASVSGPAGAFTAQADASAPTGGAFSANGTAASASGTTSYLTSGTTLTIDSRTDYAEAQSGTESGLASSTLTMRTGTLSGDTCSGYGAPATISGTTSQTVASGNCYELTLTGTDNVGNAATVKTTVKVDTSAPSAPSSFSFSSLTNAYDPGTGSTVYFKAGSAGGFTATASGASDGDTGVTGYSYGAIAGAGWSNTNGAYSFTAASPTGTGSATAANGAGVSGPAGTFTAQADANAPAGSAFSANGTAASGGGTTSYLTTGTTLTIDSRTNYTETQSATESGLASSILTMRTGTLSGNTCSAYGAPATISGTTSQTVASGNCYELTLTATDNVGNTASVKTTVMADTTQPSAPDVNGFSFSALSNAYYPGTGSTVYFQPGTAGGFTVSASGATDADTGISGYTYGAIAGAGWSNTNGAYTFTAASPTGTGSVTATNGASVSGPGTSFTAQADSNAPTGGAFSANGTAATGGGSTSYISSGTTLTIDSRTDYAETQGGTESGLASSVLTMRTGTLSGNTCSGYGAPATIAGTTSQTVASGSCYELTLTGTDNVGNAASVKTTVKVDTSAPSAPASFGFSALSNAYYPGSGSTVFFQGGTTGSFTVTASGATDAESDVSGYAYPALGTGWSNTNGAYSFDATAGTQSGSVTASNNAGLPGPGATFTALSDTTAPTGGAFSANGTAASAGGTSSYLNAGTTLTIDTRTDYAETPSASESGLASSTLTMRTGTLSGSSCSGYGAPTTISGTTSQTVASGNCYLLTLTGTDHVGNARSITTTVMVDTTAPSAPTGFTSGLSGSAYWPGAGSIVYFQGGGTGGFTVAAAGSTDGETGITSYNYPSLGGLGWSNTGSAYTFSGAATTQSGSVTATNGASLTGPGASFTAQADTNAPAGGALSANGTAASGGGTTSYLTTGTTLTIDSRTNYTETQSATESGLASSILTMRTGTLSGNTCSAYGAPATISGTTSQTVASGNCYELTLTGIDNVGNSASVSTVVMVDTTPPSAPATLGFGSLTNAYYPGTGSTVYFQPGTAGGFTVTAGGAGDGDTGITSYTYGAIAGAGWSDTNGAYSFTAASTTGTGSVTATNGAGVSGGSTTFTAQGDSSAPAGGAFSANGTAASAGGTTSYLTSGTTLTIDSRTDYTESQSGTESGLATSTLTMRTGTLSGNTCSGYGAPATISGTASQAVASGNCYLLTLTGTDHVGNSTSISTVVMVDTTPPSAPTSFGFSALSNAYYPGSGSTVFFQGGTTGSFTVSASGAADADTGVSGYTYPALGTGWSNADNAYAFTSIAATQSGSVTATNGASVSGAGASFTAQADTTAPTGGAFSANGTAASGGGSTSYLTSGTTLTIDSRTDYTETPSGTESGLASSTLTMRTGTLSGNSCSGYGAPSTISGATSQTVVSGNCYELTLTGTDHVGNAASITTTVMVDTTAPSAPTSFGFSSLSGSAYYPGSGSTVFFRPGTSGGFTVAAGGAADADTGIASYGYPALGGLGWSNTGNAYAFTGIAATQSGSVTATNAAGLTGPGASFTAQGDTTAPTGGALVVNGTAASAGGSSSYLDSGTTLTIGGRTDYTETPSATESGLASSTLTIQSAPLTGNSCGAFGGATTIAGTTSQTVASGNCYLLTLTGTDNVGNSASISTTVKVDTTPPSAPAAGGFSFSSLTNAYWPGAGSIVYFQPGTAGGFTVTASGATDADTGISGYTYPSLGGAGWSNTNNVYAFAGSAGTQSGSVTATNNAGLAGAGTSFTAQGDSTAPTGGAFSANGTAASAGGTTSYLNAGTTLTIDSRTDYTEGQSATESGLASSVLTIQAGTLSGNTCTGYGSASTISGTTSQTVASGNCYLLTLTGTDNVGNAGSVSTVVMVDTTPPSAPTGFSFSALSNAYYPGGGSTVYFQPGTTGSFTVAASGATDADTGVNGYAYPALGTGWSNTNNAYTFGSSAGTQSGSVTASDNAGLAGAGTSFTAQGDSTAPTGGAFSANGTAASAGGTTSYLNAGTTLTIDSRTDYAETPSASESGLASSTLTIQSAPLTGNSCGAFGGATTIAGTASQTVASGNCYLLTLTGTDNVGNSASISTTVKVDASGPSAPSLAFSGLSGNASWSSAQSTLYVRPSAGGAFTVTASSSDPDSGIQGYTFDSLDAAGGSGFGETQTGDHVDYTFGAGAVAPTAARSVTATDNAGLTASSSYSVVADTTGPAGGALSVDGTAATGGGATGYSATGNLTLAATDYTEAVSATQSGLASSTLTRQSASFTSPDTCGAFGGTTTLPTGTTSDPGLATGCYLYTLTGVDNVGNSTQVQITVEVDTSAPSAPTLSFANAGGGAYYPGSGTTVWFDPAAAIGTFDVTASASDADTGIGSYGFPSAAALGTNWSVSGSGATRTYSYVATAGNAGIETVTAANRAGGSASSDFTVQPDTTAPAGGALTVDGNAATSGDPSIYSSSGDLTLAVTDYAETQGGTESGLAASTLTRQFAAYSGTNTCGAFGSATTLSSATTSDNGLASGCYLYTLTGTDHVGNTTSIQITVKVDTADPTTPTLSFTGLSGNASFSSGQNTLYVRPDSGGAFTVTASSIAAGTGIAGYTFQTLNSNGGANFGESISGNNASYTFDGSATVPATARTVTATSNAGRSSSTTYSVVADTTAPAGGSLTVDGTAATSGGTTIHSSTGNLTLAAADWAEAVSPTDSGLAASTLTQQFAAYSATDTCGAFGTATTLSSAATSDNGLATGCYLYTLTGTDNVGNTASIQITVEVDTSAPSAPALAFSGLSANAFWASGRSTLFIRPSGGGAFTVTASSTDGDTGIQGYGFQTLNSDGGASFAESVSGDTGSYTFGASTTVPATARSVTATNNAGGSSSSSYSIVADTTAPAGGALTVNGTAATGVGTTSYSSTGTVTIAATDWSEPATASDAGLASSTLTRESAAFAATDICGAFGGLTTLPSSQTSDSGLTTGCYRYTLTGVDEVGNTVSIETIVEVDTSAPTGLALTLSNASGNAYYAGSGSSIWFNPNGSGSFDVAASATDSDTGVAGYGFPSVGASWSASGSGASRTYSFSAPAGSGGDQTVTATNKAGGSASTTFTLSPDSVAPVTTAQCDAGSCSGGWYTSSPVSVTLSASDVGGSGVAMTRYTTDGSTPTPLTGTAYSGAISVSTTTTLVFRSWDNVGNAEAPTTLTVSVDTTAPSLPPLGISESSPNESVSGTTLYYNPSGSNSASFDVVATPTDGESGVEKTTFPSLTGMGAGGDVSSSPYSWTYSWDSTATTAPGTSSVSATNVAGLSSSRTFTVLKDVTPPSGTAISYTAGFDTTGSVAFTTSDGTDGGSGVAGGTGVFERSTEPYANGACSGTWSTWTAVAGGSPDTVADGTCVQYRYRISDNVGNEQIATGGIVEVDTTAPSTSITGQPGDPSSVTTPTFTFAADETSTFECNLDSGGWTSCSSPDTLGALGEGSHTFQVRATDAAGNTDSTPASYTWYVDLTPPTVSVTAPADGSNVGGAAVALTASASDNHDPAPAVTFEYAHHGVADWTSTGASWDTTALGDGRYDLEAIATDSAGNQTTSALVTVDVDNHAPSITFSAPGQYVNAAAPATIPITVTTADTDIASVQFYECSNADPTCAGGTWNAIGSAVTSAPWTTSWTPPASDGVKALKAIATDLASNTGSDVHAVTIDRTAPSGVTIDYADGYSAGGSVTLTTSNGPDADVNAATGVIERRTAPLAADSCSGWSGWSAVAGPTDTVPDATCAQYRYTVSDNAGNPATATGANTVKVDQTAPTGVSLAFGGFTNASASGSTVFVQTGAAGGFTVTPSATDAESGLGTTTFPSLGAGWSGSGGAYTFDAAAAAPGGSQTVTVHDNAGLGTDATFTVVSDTAAPTGGSVSYANGFHGSGSVDVTVAAGTDNGGSGIASKLLERASTTLTNGSCDLPFSSFSVLAGDPVSPYTDATLASGHCYQYEYVVTDAVGNVATYTSPYMVEVDTDNPTATVSDPGDNLRGTITLAASAVSDTGGSGVASVDFQVQTDPSGGWQTVGTDTTAPYSVSFDTKSPTQYDGAYDFRAVAHDAAGNSGASAAVGPRTLDNTPPATTITTEPANPSNTSTPDFGFSSSESGSTFECSLDGAAFSACGSPITLPTLGEGPHTFHVQATDVAGNTDPTPASYSWTVDTVPPAASMSDPGAYLNGTVALTSTSTDVGGTGIASVTFEYSAAGSGGPWTSIGALPWNTKTGPDAVADGLYDLHVVATDNAGNVATSDPVSNVRVDNTAPAVSITTPVTNGGIAGTVTLAATTTDADPTPAIVWKVSPTGAGTWTTVPATWNTKTGTDAVADGQYDVEAIATDWAGNTTTTTVTNVTVDNQPPVVAVTVPTDGGYVNAAASDPYTVSATASDAGTGVKQVDFYECTTSDCSSKSAIGTDATGSAGTYSASWPVPADGSYWIEAVSTDNVGHASSSVAAVTVDRTLPDTTLLTQPGDPTNVPDPTFTFSADEATQRYECSLDGGAWTTCASPDTLAPTPADGSHTFEIRAVDLAGNTDASPASWTWHEDRTFPTATLTDPAAANPAHAIRGTVALASTTADPTTNGYASGIDPATLTYQYSADGTTWATIADPAAWDTTQVTDGVYQMQVLVTDFAGNTTTSAAVANVKIDNTPPLTSQDDPGQYLRQTIALTGTAADPPDPQGVDGSGIDHVDFQVSPAGAGTWTTVGTWTPAPGDSIPHVNFDTTTALTPDGHYDFRTVAYDVAGNEGDGTPVTSRLIDNTKPVAQIVDPGANLRGTVNLATDPAGTLDPGGANASGIVATTFQVSSDGTNWTTVGTPWNTTGVPDGIYTVRATVTDAAGNVSDPSDVGSRRVDNTPPTTTASGVPSGFSASDVTVTLSASDSGSGVSDTLFEVDGGPAQHGTSVLIPAPSNGSNDGTHTITYQSVDVAGNVESQHSVTVEIDATPPACPSCSASDYLNGTVTLDATPTDSGAGIKSVEFQNSPDGSAWTSIGTDSTGVAGTYSTSWDTTAAGDGAYHLQALITDNADNVSTIDLHSGGAGVVVVDNTAPTVSVGAPTGGTFVGGSSVTISASSSDANPLTYDFLVNGSVIASGSSASATWDTTGLSDGSAQVQVRATDPAGNSTTSSAVTVAVDNHAPNPSINDPGSAISGTKTLSVSTDGDTATVEFQERAQGAATWSSIATVGPPFQASFDTTVLTDGAYELRAIATDQAGHTGTSATRTVTIDNTNPTGSLTAPLGGKTIGGPNAPLSASAADTGSGVASVEFQYAPSGTNGWASIATVTSSPYQTTWDASAVATANYDLRLVITDNAGNTKTTSVTTVHVDSTAPSVTLNDPGASLSGTTSLTADTSGPDAVSVAFEISPAGANTWQTISTDTTSPWSASFDTTTVGDGLYDIQAVASDSLGNQGTSVITGVSIDNHAPSIASAVPADGSVVASATSITLDESETSTLTGITLDGLATVAPTVTGTHVVFATGALSEGPHTLAATLTDTSGKTTPIRLHFTVLPAPAATTPYVEKNASLTASTTLTAADGDSSATMPAHAWSGSTNPGDWLVLRVAPTTSTALAPSPAPIVSVVDVSAHWALAGTDVHTFDQPLAITMAATQRGLVPTTFDGSSWRLIKAVPSAGQLPASWSDGYWSSGGVVHVLTRHLTLFALVADKQAPSAPNNVAGTVNDGHLYLRWAAGADNGTVAGFTVFVDGVSTAGLGGTEYQWDAGPYDPADPRAFTLYETDDAGNWSPPSVTVKVVPTLAGLSLDDARAALAAKGYGAGDVTVVDSTAPEGTVVGPTDLVVAEAGSSIPLQVSAGPGGAAATKFVFGVVSTRRLVLGQRNYIGVHLAATRATTLTATLLAPAPPVRPVGTPGATRLKAGVRPGKHGPVGGSRVVQTWHLKVKAGVTIAKLPLSAKARRPGRYVLTWVAVSGADVARGTRSVEIFATAKKAAASLAKRTTVDVVVAGSELPKELPAVPKQAAQRVVSSTGDSTFAVTGDPKRNVQVIVVDVDEYGLGLVHDLRTVFPNVKLIALTSDVTKLALAVRAGATIALPKRTPTVKLAKVVSTLVGATRIPAAATRR